MSINYYDFHKVQMAVIAKRMQTRVNWRVGGGGGLGNLNIEISTVSSCTSLCTIHPMYIQFSGFSQLSTFEFPVGSLFSILSTNFFAISSQFLRNSLVNKQTAKGKDPNTIESVFRFGAREKHQPSSRSTFTP